MPEGFSNTPPLPAFQTAEERAANESNRLQQALRYANPPAGNPVTPAEFAPMEGVLINVPLYGDTVGFFGDLISGVLAGGAVPYILVDSNYTANVVKEEILGALPALNRLIEALT